MSLATILVVDDAAVDRRLIGGLLEQTNLYSVEYAVDGKEAIEALRHELPDLVLTDMQMPEMNGLELVTAIRQRYDKVPVVLITAHGSEALAADALRRGAASYVPKSHLKDLLLETVHNVLEISHARGSDTALLKEVTLNEINFELRNETARSTSLVEMVQHTVANMGICDATGSLQVGIALEQALENAVYHGNLELNAAQLHPDSSQGGASLVEKRLSESPYRDRKVFLDVKLTRDEAQIVVRDEGPGFDVKGLSKVAISSSLTHPSGRGFVLMWALMDKVRFNGKGNQVTLIKHRETREAEGAAAAMPEKISKIAEKREGPLGQLKILRTGTTIKLTKRRVLVGRDSHCEVVLNDAGVSRQHCLLFVYDGWWYVRDLKSSNGIRVNEMQVKQGRLAPGARLSVARHEFEIDYDLGDLGAVGITPPVDPF